MTSEEAPVAVIDALEAGQFDYMLVGSCSSNHYGIQRSTKDADFVMALGKRSIRELTARLPEEFKLDLQMSFASIYRHIAAHHHADRLPVYHRAEGHSAAATRHLVFENKNKNRCI